MLDSVAARFGDHEALVLRDRRLTYRELHGTSSAPGLLPGKLRELTLRALGVPP